jgi:hypothetical protein
LGLQCVLIYILCEKVNLANLLDIIDKAGGWHLTGNSNIFLINNVWHFSKKFGFYFQLEDVVI